VDASALDFWIGEWDCTWAGGAGTNAITRELGGRVVVERFHAGDPDPFDGLSVSAFDELEGWRQTWVDSNGGYWHLVGVRLDDGDLAFTTPGPADREGVVKRMVFSNVTPDGFDWRWEASPDGMTWRERWAIRYARRA
jgi:hypothetical protein